MRDESFPAPFDAIAGQYDSEFTETAVGRLQRAIVHDFLEKFIAVHRPPSTVCHVLELNCGTGEDAIWLARRGCRVLATDVSPEMVAVAREKVRRAGLENLVDVRVCPIQEIGNWKLGIGNWGDEERGNFQFPISNSPTFDLVFSNFGGLNCISPLDLERFGTGVLPKILRPGGQFVAVVMGRFCWWETAYFLAKGQWRTAFRRRSRKPVAARLDASTTVKTWYYAPHELSKFIVLRKESFGHHSSFIIHPVGFWLPPSYLDPLFRRFPRLLRLLDFLEKRCRGSAWAGAADHYLIGVRDEECP